MNKINPAFILIFFVVILLFALIKTDSLKKDILENQVTLSNVLAKAKEIGELKKRWDSKNDQRKVDSILSQPHLSGKFETKKSQDRYIITANNLDKDAIDQAMKSFLNEPLKIKSFELDRVGDNNISFRLEIEL